MRVPDNVFCFNQASCSRVFLHTRTYTHAHTHTSSLFLPLSSPLRFNRAMCDPVLHFDLALTGRFSSFHLVVGCSVMRWAQKSYRKSNLGTYLKFNPLMGASHAKGIVLEKMYVLDLGCRAILSRLFGSQFRSVFNSQQS